MSFRRIRPLALAAMVILAGCSSIEGYFGSEKIPVATSAPVSARDNPRGIAPAGSEVLPPVDNAPFEQQGDGNVVQAETPSRATQTPAGDITLNFNAASLQDVANAILGQILGLKYSIDPNLQTRVTIRTTRPMARSELLPAFESVLQSNGMALLRADGSYRIAPLDGGAATGPVFAKGTFGGAGGGAPGTHVIPLKYASARQLQKLLEPFVPTGGALQVDDTRNVLLLSGARDIASFRRMIETFDVDWLRGMSYSLLSLKHGNAASVAQEVNEIISSGAEGSLSGIVRVIPIQRINAILLVSPQQAYIQRARDWIERLDNGVDESAPRIYVYNVQNSRAADVAKVLSDMFGGNVQTVQPAVSAGVMPKTMPGSTMTQIGSQTGTTGSSAASAGLPAGAITSASPTAVGGSAPLPRSPAETAVAASTATAASKGDSGLQARIVADEKNNALVIMARPREYQMIEAALKRLDVLPQQVLIEATIAEVTLNDDLQFGLQWFFNNGRATTTLSTAASGAVAATFPGASTVLNWGDARVVLSALKEITNVNVVSAPQLMVLDHQTAMLQVGDEVPIAVQQARSVVDPDAPIVNSVQLRSTGVILKVTPRVNGNGMATLEIEQEVSDVARTTTSNIDSPTIQQRRIRSVVAAGDNQTIALGGLIRESKSNSRSGIPILQDIPLLGHLASTTSRAATRTELLILLTPRVVRNPEEARSVTEELQQRMQGLAPLKGRGI
jgi:general secretion pathway protein D